MKLKGLIFISLLLTIAACGESIDEDTTASENEEVEAEEIGKIVTSLYPIEYIISEITGDLATVETVIPPGADAHVYEPSTREMIELANSDAFFYIGEGMEAFAETMANTIEDEGVYTLALSNFEEELFMEYEDDHKHDHDHEDDHNHEEEHDHEDEHNHDDDHSHDHDHDHGDFDPHFWLDPSRMISVGQILLDELSEIYPEHEDLLQENYEQFANNMLELDTNFQEALTVDQDVNILVAHGAFGYWEQSYGINQYSIRGLSSSQEPSQRELQELFESLDELNINHVFLEKNREDRLAYNIANEFDLAIYELHNLETLTEEDIENDQDYIDIMLENLDLLLETIEE
ncbi:metal ABC transporter solute-binding protein, Zn/Mn family [Alkalibacillus silvisoli]|uniref:Metal ABC transporter substrate-binding protein n=1 Tax=Alkalibacillus silvisoli TaxID=392823 RepID=A0ABP3JXE5_9BACI